MRKLKNDFTLEEYIDVREEQIKQMTKQIASLRNAFKSVYNEIADLYELTWNSIYDDVTDYSEFYDATDIDEASESDDHIVEDANEVSNRFNAVYNKLDEIYHSISDLSSESNNLFDSFNGNYYYKTSERNRSVVRYPSSKYNSGDLDNDLPF